MEHAPLCFEEQLVVEEALYDLGNMLDVDVFIPGEEGVIYVNKNKPVQHSPEHVIHMLRACQNSRL